MKRTLDLIPCITIHPDKICTYISPNWSPNPPARDKTEKSIDEKLLKIEHIIDSSRSAEGNVSKLAKKKISKSIDYLILFSKKKGAYSRLSGKEFSFKIAFVTLTLPSRQVHSDNEIKNKCLNQFIIEIKKKYRVKNYVWRAEKQKNGNVHFHILIDKYIPWEELRNNWNRIINKMGYIDRYRETQKNWHKNGFRVRDNLLPTWSKAKQLQAYLSGARTHWNNPNSTDIHSIKKIKNIKSYVQKYVTKSSERFEFISAEIQKIAGELTKQDNRRKKRRLIVKLRRLRFQCKMVEYKEKVKGRIWGCNSQLQNIKGFRADVDNEICAELNRVINESKCHCYKDYYFQVFYINFDQLPNFGGTQLFRYFCNYLFEQFGFSYQSSFAA